MLSYPHRLIWAVALVMVGRLAAAAQSAESTPKLPEGLIVSFAPNRVSTSLHEPVVLHFSARNALAERVTIDLGWNRVGNISLTIVEPDGSTIHPVQQQRGGMSRVARVPLEAGASYAQDLLLNEWYGFDQPGDYRIAIALAGEIHIDSGAVVEGPPPQEVALSVGPRNPVLLARACQELADKAISPEAESALDAAKALSYVADLIAVPYLGKLTRSGPFVVIVRGMAINGLNRIAAAEGVQAVVSRLAAEDRELAPQITGHTSTPAD